LSSQARGCAPAAIPDPSGAIHACYRSNGNLRLVDKSGCTGAEWPGFDQTIAMT
jgi:hypothetical protein